MRVFIVLLSIFFNPSLFANEAFNDDLFPNLYTYSKIKTIKSLNTHACINTVTDIINVDISKVAKRRRQKALAIAKVRLRENCKRSIDKIYDILDYDIGKNHTIFFSSKLVRLLNDYEIEKMLDEFIVDLSYSIESEESFNIWYWMKNYYNDDYKATEVMAILFQTMSTNIGRQIVLPGSESLEKLKLIHAVLRTPENIEKYSYLPSEVEVNRRGHYHYHVVKYLTLQLKRTNPNATIVDFLVAGIFNANYEHLKAQNKINFTNLPLKLNKTTGNARDIFMGYAGVINAIAPDLYLDKNYFLEAAKINYKKSLEFVVEVISSNI